MTTQQTYIHWKKDEILAVSVKALEDFQANVYTSFIDALMNAQAILIKPERQRPRSSLAQKTKQYRELAEPALVEKRSREALEKAQRAAEQTRLQEEATKAAAFHAEAEPINEDYMLPLLDGIAAKYKQALLVRLRAATEEAFAEIHEDVNLRVTAPLPSVDVATKKPKVAVVGFRQDQGDHVARHLRGKLDIVTVPTIDGLSVTRLKQVAENADFVLLNGKFSGHNHQDAVRNHPGFILFDGGVSACIRRLEQLFLTGK